MRISRACDYAICCTIFLAKNKNKTFILPEISEKCNAPSKFLSKILQALAKNGIISSKRGINGGFCFHKDAKDVNVMDIFKAIEGYLAINYCTDIFNPCEKADKCPAAVFWKEVQFTLDKLFKETTVDDLINGW